MDINIAGPLPDSAGHKYILVLVDGFSSFVSLVPMKNIAGDIVATSFGSAYLGHRKASTQTMQNASTLQN